MQAILFALASALLLAVPVSAFLFFLAWRWSAAELSLRQFAEAVFDDIGNLCAPCGRWLRRVWIFIGPRLTNNSMWSAIATNLGIAYTQFAAGPEGQAFLAEHPWLYFVGVVAALLASRPPGTPHRIPEPNKAGAPGVEAIGAAQT